MSSYSTIVMAAFADEMEKQAILGAIGKGALRALSRGAKATGMQTPYVKALTAGRGAVGAKNLTRAAGAATIGTGVVGSMAVGSALTGRR